MKLLTATDERLGVGNWAGAPKGWRDAGDGVYVVELEDGVQLRLRGGDLEVSSVYADGHETILASLRFKSAAEALSHVTLLRRA